MDMRQRKTHRVERYLTKNLPRISFVEFKILVLLSDGEMHVRELRRALGDYGSVSRYLVRLKAKVSLAVENWTNG